MKKSTRQLLDIAEKHVLFVTKRPSVVMAKGKGMYLVDTEGRRYLDFIGGWAVTSLGHSPTVVERALKSQSRRLITPSPSFYNDRMIELASLLTGLSGLDRAWFGNSGAEVNEAAVKLARKWCRLNRNGAYEVITTLHGFHGRTLAMMAATGKDTWKDLFEPKTPGFIHVPFDDLDAVRSSISEKTAAIMLEPVQGEGGVNIPSPGYLKGLREICDQNGFLLIFDEIQTGLGRTGKMFGFQHEGVLPDIMTLAKGLGSGYPVSAMLAKEKYCVFDAGDHGGTFGGQPLAMAVALAVMKEISVKGLCVSVEKMGTYLKSLLKDISAEFGLSNIRGLGLLVACNLPVEKGTEVVAAALENGLLINSPNPDCLRFMPALIASEKHVDEMIQKLIPALKKVLLSVE
jgi:acetylornithine/N-succinyldiaminopimelate aminotransferase